MSRWSVKLVGGAGAVALAALVVVGFGIEAASAGGWAMSSLDTMAAPVAGKQTDVGFTIRQHGVTPVNPDGEVGVNVRSTAGADQFFPASPSGPPGHYVARVRIAAPGAYSWQIRQGWFAVQELGRIDVAAPTATAAGTAGNGSGTGGSTYRWPVSVRVLLPALGLGLAAFAVADAVAARRRRSGATTPRRPIEA